MPHTYKRKVQRRTGLASERIDSLIASLPPVQRTIAVKLRRLINAASPALTEEVKWGYPTYLAGGFVCAIMPMRETVNFVLHRGAELDDPQKLIEGTGKSMRHIKLRKPADIKSRAFAKFIRETIRLDIADRS
jgi:hypothetical protein